MMCRIDGDHPAQYALTSGPSVDAARVGGYSPYCERHLLDELACRLSHGQPTIYIIYPLLEGE